MSIHGVLGAATSYPKHYHPEALFAIPRSQGRDVILSQYPNLTVDSLGIGVDWWHAFEVSWLNHQGISQVALARFAIPASSPNIVESKSLKLYLNSLNFTAFASSQALIETITQDLSACVGAPVQVSLFGLDAVNDGSGLLISRPNGRCIDQAFDGVDIKIALTEHPDASLLGRDKVESEQDVTYQLYSNLLRSNCPVTDQPDWGTLAIEMSSRVVVNEANLLDYVLSFRQHNGFHEQCVEQIFADLMEYFVPSQLIVRAWYTRRGGIDINPCRVSDIGLLPTPSRLVRQ
ncbi:MAG: NADPH-dependent 7-cyano-7-deazaguanine reductase QueF [Psychrobacter sp.]|nr:NADPH-dependent 7-cyano-7-deazaguanine reductase QueF [Psychrobacter sp.]